MKQCLFILSVFCGLSVFAETLTVKDGTVYQNVTIVSVSPEHMLVVHDGGGIQIYFEDLVADSLTPAQRLKVEEEMQYYVKRQARIKQAVAEREAFEAEQRARGLIEFEGAWMTLLEKEELLLAREERRLALEQQRLQIAKERAALEKEQLEAERARYLLEGEKKSGTTISVGYFSSYHRSRGYWYSYSHGKRCYDKSGYKPSLYTRNNFTCPSGNSSARVFIDAGKPLSYSSGMFNR